MKRHQSLMNADIKYCRNVFTVKASMDGKDVSAANICYKYDLYWEGLLSK